LELRELVGEDLQPGCFTDLGVLEHFQRAQLVFVALLLGNVRDVDDLHGHLKAP
jgi:hypothetical protein